MNIIEVYRKFPTQEDCIDYLEAVRWQGKPYCPYCGAFHVTPLPKEHRHHCNACNTSFSVTVGTIFHKTKLDLQKWFLAIGLMLDARKGISSRQLSRHLEVNKNTAWYMNMRIRKAMFEPRSRDLLMGIVEMDETYIGGKPRKGNRKKDRKKHTPGTGTDKTPVVGMVERGGKIKAKVVSKDKLNGKGLSALIRENIDVKNTVLMTDEFGGYHHVSKFIEHKTVNHQVQYVNGNIHTNTIENFWSLLKRGIVGQFHKVSVRYLPKYIDEFCFRLNYRNHKDIFGLTISRALGVIA